MKSSERLLILAASWAQIPAIVTAKQRGYEVITCDNRPDNPGHKLADRSLNISTVDREAVLAKARELQVDGVLAYGTDIAALTAAYVAENLGLPTHPYESIQILTEKHLFREYLDREGFHRPAFRAAEDPGQLAELAKALMLPVVVKPVDSSGSKGVTKVEDPAQMRDAFEEAAKQSRQETVIVEEFVEAKGYQLTGDGFLIDGELVFRAFANQHFAPGGDPCQPTGESLPAAFSVGMRQRIHDEVQRLMTGLGMRTGALNFDIRVDEQERIHFLEIGPRCGGNRLPTLIQHATGVDLTAAAIEAALGHEVRLTQPPLISPCGSYNLIDMLTAYGLRGVPKDRLISIAFRGELLSRLVFSQFELTSGERIDLAGSADFRTPPFHPDELAVGFLLMQFEDPREATKTLDQIDQYIQIEDRSPQRRHGSTGAVDFTHGGIALLFERFGLGADLLPAAAELIGSGVALT